MAGFIKGDVAVIPFSFSDLSGSKRRPALVITNLPGDDILLVQITSQHKKDNFAIPLTNIEFNNGFLPSDSYIRPSRLFTADKNIIIRKAGTVKDSLIRTVIQKIIQIIET